MYSVFISLRVPILAVRTCFNGKFSHYVRYVPAAITKDKLKCFNSIVHRDVATPNLAMLYG